MPGVPSLVSGLQTSYTEAGLPGFSGLPETALCGAAVQRACAACEHPEPRLGHGKGTLKEKEGCPGANLELKEELSKWNLFLIN